MKHWERDVQVVVRALVLRGDRALVVRSNSPPSPGVWGFPGGFIEPTETLVQAVERELLEETGLAGRAQGLVSISNRRLPGGRVIISLLIAVDAPGGEPRPDTDEVDRADFVAVNDLPGLLGPAVRWVPAIRRVIAGAQPLPLVRAEDDLVLFGLAGDA